MGSDLARLIKESKEGDESSFARLLSLVERNAVVTLSESQLLSPDRFAFRLGITGPPGSGKSTLIGEMLKNLVNQNLKVGVLAVDPSSPFSQGAVLGDRIRYMDAGEQMGPGNLCRVFIRSLGTRGSLGGLSASAYLMLRAFDACDFDLVLVETVGVGQIEVEIMNVADWVTLVLVPESGDSIQAMKAGVMEIADQYLVNKADRPGAESLKREVEAQIALRTEGSGSKGTPQVDLVSAIKGSGVNEFTESILRRISSENLKQNRNNTSRLRAEGFALIRAKLEDEAKKNLMSIEEPKDLVTVLKKLKF